MTKKKVIAAALATLMLSGVVAGCTPATDTTTATTTEGTAATEATTSETTAPVIVGDGDQLLKIWSFTNEIKTMALAFQKYNPDVAVEYTMIPMTNGEYQTKVQASLTTDDVPDVIVLEASFVKSYVESDLLADLGELLPKAAEMETYQMTIDIGTFDGVTKAFSYQATPGAFFYRRSLATEYFGTDDPTEIQTYFSDMAKFEESAAVIKEKSGGDTYTVCSTGDFTNLFYANREQPWIVDGKFVIDPMVDEMMDMALTFRSEGYEAQATQWQEGWFAGMNDTLTDANGNAKKVFSYFLPTWGLPYVLMTNAEAKDEAGTVLSTTAGDWACIAGPMAYQWGGTWVGVMDTAKNKESGMKFVEFVALDEENLTNWATGVYTNEYLKEIDPSIADDIAQPAGDFVSSAKVVAAIMDTMATSKASEFLGGQNAYEGFSLAAPKTSLKLLQGSDDAIQRAMNDPLNNYVTGAATKEEAIQQFKDAVTSEFPDIIVE